MYSIGVSEWIIPQFPNVADEEKLLNDTIKHKKTVALVNESRCRVLTLTSVLTLIRGRKML